MTPTPATVAKRKTIPTPMNNLIYSVTPKLALDVNGRKINYSFSNNRRLINEKKKEIPLNR